MQLRTFVLSMKNLAEAEAEMNAFLRGRHGFDNRRERKERKEGNICSSLRSLRSLRLNKSGSLRLNKSKPL
jgi:hypothetical protein